jgi:hypothetical protein
VPGALQAWQMSYIDPTSVFGLNVALVPIAMVLFAGSGLRFGPLVGVVVLASMQQWLLVGVQGFQHTLYGLTILLIGRFMPGGFLRAKWVRRVPGLKLLGREHHEHVGETAASLAAKGDISVSTALLAIAAALGSNLLVKCALAFSSGGRSFGLAFIAGMAAPTVVFAAVLTVVLR